MISNPLRYFAGTSTQVIAHRGAMCQLNDVIDYFFVAHPRSGADEGHEHERVMYFFSSSLTAHDVSRQTEVTGFAEAIVNFLNDFIDRDAPPPEEEFPYREVMTEKTAQVYVQIEGGEFLMGLSLEKKACKDFEYTIFPPTLRTIVSESYKLFKLFFGTFTALRNRDQAHFQEQLECFFTRYLLQQRLYYMPLLNYFVGADFQTLRGAIFLTLTSLMNEITEEFPQVAKLLFLYQDKLMYYTVDKKDVPSLYRYLTENLLPMSLRAELEPTNTSKNGPKSGKFLTGPTELNNDDPLDASCTPPKVFLTNSDGTYSSHELLAYRAHNATVCMFVSSPVTRQLMRNINSFLGSELVKLANEIGAAVSAELESINVADCHFVYYNPSSMSLTTSFPHSLAAIIGSLNAGSSTLPTVPAQVHKIACETYDRMVDSKQDFGETMVQDTKDWWILVKKVNDRILVLLLPPTANLGTLQDAHTRANEIIKSRFEHVFLL